MDDLEARWAERDKKRTAYEAEMERRRQEHKARPLVERLRDCGTFIALDGHPSYAPPRADDAKEAADEIERLRGLLARLEWIGMDAEQIVRALAKVDWLVDLDFGECLLCATGGVPPRPRGTHGRNCPLSQAQEWVAANPS